MNEIENAIKVLQSMIKKNKFVADYEEDSDIVAHSIAENEVLGLAIAALREKLTRDNPQAL